ncbi:hypothetical protein [Kingella oralis]
MRLVPTGHLLFFASPKKSKQKKGDPDVQVWLRQTSLTPHPYFRRVRTSRTSCAVGQRTLVSEKRMLRSAGRRGDAVAPNGCSKLTKWGSLKSTLSNKKPFGRTPNGFVFSGCLMI